MSSDRSQFPGPDPPHDPALAHMSRLSLRDQGMNPAAILRLLLSPLYSGALAHEHRADLEKSGLSPETIRLHQIMAVPPDLIAPLVAFREDPLREVRSAMLLPYPTPAGGWMEHVRVKVFPPFTGRDGHLVKYLGPRGWPPRLFFPLATLPAVLRGDGALWLVEGAKKSLAVAQLGLPAVGFEGVEAWHAKGSRELLGDFDAIRLRGRVVELVPDADVQTNAAVERGALRFAEALEARGARIRLVTLPVKLAV